MAYNQFPEHPDDSVGGWMLTLFLMGLPLVGFVYLLVLALGSGGSPATELRARRTHLADHLRTRGGSFLRSLRRSDYGVAPGLEYVTSRRTASVLVGAASESLGCRPHIVWGFTLPSEYAQYV